jgi:hypothetical protein
MSLMFMALDGMNTRPNADLTSFRWITKLWTAPSNTQSLHSVTAPFAGFAEAAFGCWSFPDK